MPTQDPGQSQSPSPFEIVTPGRSKKTGAKGIIVAVSVVAFLALGILAGVILVRQRQEISEKAAIIQCPGAQACPDPQQPSLLKSCTPAKSDNSPNESLCNSKGRVESCGGRQYCCPGPNQAWSTNLTLCATPVPTIAPLVSQAAAPTATATATATPSTTATPTSTEVPIPETGTGWPTYLGVGIGILVIIGSLLLAL